MRKRLKHIVIFGGLASATLSMPALAQETTTYTYDALGRVTNVDQTGGRNDNTHAVYQYDAAGNRRQVTVTCPPNSNPGLGTACAGFQPHSGRFIVVPLNDFTLIPVM